ncbi:hypothetical protein DSO57_1024053 [Entomophthora muscae]|uniref:Uncharacterized protein n=1 Tax=Entomophthora muscae TaxID=34485 RepID=A0ACC2S4V6_9FUNG|nr:hypothetical protein DSO57_1024053 [Entomophthora muscae]
MPLSQPTKLFITKHMLSQPKFKEIQMNYSPEEVNSEPRRLMLQKQLMNSSMTTPENPYPHIF